MVTASKPGRLLLAYATDKINLAQLYTAIGSPAGGKWQEPEEDDYSEGPDMEPDPE